MVTGAEPALDVDELHDLGGLEAIRDEWSELWKTCPLATPFQAPEWLIPWCRYLGGGRAWTLALRSEGKLVGLAPLHVYTPPETGERTLLLLGTGISDYLDVLTAPAWEARVLARLFRHLDEHADRWDVIDFQQVRSVSPLRVAPVPAGWARDAGPQDVCPHVELGGGEGGSKPRWRKRLGYDRRRGDRMGRLELERATPESFPDLFQAFLRLHGARWSAVGQPGVVEAEPLRRFHEEAARGLVARGVLRLYGLRLGERYLAAYYGFLCGATAYYYLGGFDPEYRSLGLGALIVGHAMEQAAAEGARTFDFLRGQEPYKYEWGAKDRPNYRVRLRRG